MNKSKLIFVTSIPISALFAKKVDIDWFNENGFDVEYWDLSPLFWDKERITQFYAGSHTYKYIGPKHQLYANHDEVKANLQRLEKDNTNIFYLSRFHLITNDDWFFKELHKLGLSYHFQNFDTSSKPKNIFRQLKAYASGFKHRYLNRHLNPISIFGSGLDSRKISKQIFPKAKFISVPSIKVLWEPTERVIHGAYNLFVDENMDHTPDAILLGEQICTNNDAYYRRMNNLFKNVENWTGVPTVIAASGKYIYPVDRYEGRQIIYGKTLPLIQNSNLVLGHTSLALDQCIVSEKPVITVIDPDFTTYKLQDFRTSLIHLIRKPILTHDVTKEVISESLKIDTTKYKKVSNDYLKENFVKGNHQQSVKEALLSCLQIK